MKLNKPKVTDNQSELESYVESLLKDNVELVPTADSKVTPLRSKKSHAKDSIPDNNSASSEVSEPRSKKQHTYIEESLSPQVSKSNVAEGLNRGATDNEKTAVKENRAKHATTVRNDQIESVAKDNQSASDIVNPDKLKPSAENLNKKPVSKNNESSKASVKTDAAQQHHEKITKEFKAYQESVHANIPEPDPRLKNVEKLLSRIALASVVTADAQSDLKTSTESFSETQLKPDTDKQESQAVSAEVAEASFLHRDAKPMKDLLGDVFQTLVFEVHKLPLAVPLVKLGGIVNFSQEDVTPLVGTPDWFLGLVPNERGNLMVVDTQKFLMPEKVPSEPVEYEYLIVLDNSNWALACHAVNDAKNLAPDDIRWSARSSKRPWFAGMVVEYMSALVEVDELINMLAENVVE